MTLCTPEVKKLLKLRHTDVITCILSNPVSDLVVQHYHRLLWMVFQL